MKKLIFAVMAFSVTAHATTSCKSITFTSGASQYLDSKTIEQGRDNIISGEVILCDLANGKSKISGGGSENVPKWSEELDKINKNVYVKLGSPIDDIGRTTAIETFHFSDSGDVIYTKSINGVALFKNPQTGEPLNFNHVSFNIGKWLIK